MDQKLVDKVTKQIIDFITADVANDLAKIVSQHVEDEDIASTVNDAIKLSLDSVSSSIPKTASKTPSKSSSRSILKDDNGNDIRCGATTIKTGAPCKNKARYHTNGLYRCGMHNTSGTGSNPDTNKRPAPKAGSSFEDAISGSHSIDHDFGAIDDINFD